MFALSTYVDQERWPSAFEPLLYPTGISFYRSFSYTPDYFEPEQLAGQFRDSRLLSGLISQPTVFGLRFSKDSGEPFTRQFIPLRMVSLSEVRVSDSIDFRFKLGPYVTPEFRQASEPPSLPKLDLSTQLADPAKVRLFIQLSDAHVAEMNKWKLSDVRPDNYWPAIARELSDFAYQKVRGALLLTLESMKERGSETILQGTELQNKVFGYQLKQGNVYDLVLRHHRVLRRGDKIPLAHVFRITNPESELSASRRLIFILGNYRAADIWVSPLAPTPGQIEIGIEPRSIDSPEKPVDPGESRAIGIQVPVSVERRFWTRARMVNLIALVGSAVAAFILIWAQRRGITEDTRKAFIGIYATCAAVFLGALKDFIADK
jgi:hypothetical protein